RLKWPASQECRSGSLPGTGAWAARTIATMPARTAVGSASQHSTVPGRRAKCSAIEVPYAPAYFSCRPVRGFGRPASRNVEDRALGVHRDVRSGIRPAGCLDGSDYLLDEGIRAGSNRCSGEPDEAVDGEVNAHLGNPG